MSALGQKQTSDATPNYVCYWGLSGHSMSAFREVEGALEDRIGQVEADATRADAKAYLNSS